MQYLKALLAVIAGLVIGSIVNMGLIMLSGHVIPPPAGADITTTEGLKASLHLFEPKHFVSPFLAHAIGTLVGAFAAAKIAPRSRWIPAMAVGAMFFIGGVISARMLPAPTWFIATDLLLAYFPSAWLGLRLARGGKTDKFLPTNHA